MREPMIISGKRQVYRLFQRQCAACFPCGIERRFVKLRAQARDITLLLGLIVWIAMTTIYHINQPGCCSAIELCRALRLTAHNG